MCATAAFTILLVIEYLKPIFLTANLAKGKEKLNSNDFLQVVARVQPIYQRD